MLNHTMFNERHESQDRAIRELQAMGYQYIPRAEAEKKTRAFGACTFPRCVERIPFVAVV